MATDSQVGDTRKDWQMTTDSQVGDTRKGWEMTTDSQAGDIKKDGRWLQIARKVIQKQTGR